MRATLLALLTAITFDTWIEPVLLAQSGADDRGVIAAVIEHTVRPQLALQSRRESADLPVYVAITSVPLCASGVLPPCVEKASIDTIRDERMSMHHVPMREFVTLAQADDLERSFVARNRTRHALAHPGNRLASMMADSAIAKYFDGVQREPGVWHFSLPAYSRDGQALLYSMYYCGPAMCGSEWLFILQRTTSGWTVNAAGLMSIS